MPKGPWCHGVARVELAWYVLFFHRVEPCALPHKFLIFQLIHTGFPIFGFHYHPVLPVTPHSSRVVGILCFVSEFRHIRQGGSLRGTRLAVWFGLREWPFELRGLEQDVGVKGAFRPDNPRQPRRGESEKSQNHLSKRPRKLPRRGTRERKVLMRNTTRP